MTLLDFLPDSVKHTLDGGVIGTALGAFFGLFTLSNITTVLGLAYLMIRISETKRFTQFVTWLRARRK